MCNIRHAAPTRASEVQTHKQHPAMIVIYLVVEVRTLAEMEVTNGLLLMVLKTGAILQVKLLNEAFQN